MEFREVREGQAETQRVWETRAEEFPGRGGGSSGILEMQDEAPARGTCRQNTAPGKVCGTENRWA